MIRVGSVAVIITVLSSVMQANDDGRDNKTTGTPQDVWVLVAWAQPKEQEIVLVVVGKLEEAKISTRYGSSVIWGISVRTADVNRAIAIIKDFADGRKLQIIKDAERLAWIIHCN